MIGNILLSASGRRVALWKSLENRLHQVAPQSHVYCADHLPELSAACIASKRGFKLPLVSDPAYFETLLQLCKQEHITTVIPLLDNELPHFAAQRETFAEAGVLLLLSNVPFIVQCHNKRLVLELFRQLGLDTPRIYDPSAIEYPCFVKPLYGSAGIGTYVAKGPDEFRYADLERERAIIMEYLDPVQYREFTLDLFYDNAHQLIEACARERLKVRGGEVEKAITRKPVQWETLLSKINYLPGAIGPVTLQFFEHRERHELLASEINPRLGGGIPLSEQAGSLILANIVAMHSGKPLLTEGFNWQEGLTMIRYEEAFFV